LAVCVAMFHTSWPNRIVDQPFFQHGTVLVDLFFVFSGFLMYALYQNKLSSARDAAAFMKRRLARLYPVHLFMLILMTTFAFLRVLLHDMGLAEQQPAEILPFEVGSSENWNSFFANLFMIHATGLTDSLTFNFPSWTISGDFIAYSLFALLMIVSPPRNLTHFIPLLLIAAILYAFLFVQKPDMDITYDYGAIRVVAGFIVGMFGAFLFLNIRNNTIQYPKSTSGAVATIFEFVAVSAFVLFVIYMPEKQQFLVSFFALFFVVVFAFNAGLISKIMSNGFFLYLAKISYSLYMVHIIIAIVMGMIADRFIIPNLPEISSSYAWIGDVYLMVYVGIVIAFAHFTWQYIEVPGNRIIKRLNMIELLNAMRVLGRSKV